MTKEAESWTISLSRWKRLKLIAMFLFPPILASMIVMSALDYYFQAMYDERDGQ